MKFLLVANFKSHKTTSDIESWLSAVAPIAAKSKNIEIVVAPSFPHLSVFTDSRIHGFTGIKLGAQDVSPFPPGSYTGAVSALQLKDLGVRYAIVGHSERREYFHETHAQVASKVRELVDVGITPIVCLRESDVIPQRAALESELITACVFCFEPEDAIGGTKIEDPREISRVTEIIKKKYSTDKVMYGGSVNKGNVRDVAALQVAGALIAGSSQDPQDFTAIINELNHVI